MKEIWKDVVGYEGLYQVSNLGRVKSLIRNVVMKQRLNKDNYPEIVLFKNGKHKTFTVHRLVALAFIPNDDVTTKTQVNHIDEDKTNNKISNLEWCTPEYNVSYGTRTERMAKTRSKKVMCITTGDIYESTNDALEKLKLTWKATISQCCRGERSYVTVNGQKCVFRYLDENDKPIEPVIEEKENLRANKVKCINNNTIYPSVTQAGKKLGLNRNYITENCKGQRDFVKKGEILYKFEYVSSKK